MPRNFLPRGGPELPGADSVIRDPAHYGEIDRRPPAECVDGRRRLNRHPDLLTMRGPGGGLAFYHVLAVLRTARMLDNVKAGERHAITMYDVLDNSARAIQQKEQPPIPQHPSFHTGTCRRCAHGLQVDLRIAHRGSHARDELNELSEIYAPRIGALASDLRDGFDLVSEVGRYQVARLEDRGVPSQSRLAAQVRRASPGVDSSSVVDEGSTAHHYLLVHHPTHSLGVSAVGGDLTYVDTPGAMVQEIRDTWGLPREEQIIATAAVLTNTLATRDTLTAAYPNGGMANYAAHPTRSGGLAVIKHEVVIPDGLNI